MDISISPTSLSFGIVRLMARFNLNSEVTHSVFFSLSYSSLQLLLHLTFDTCVPQLPKDMRYAAWTLSYRTIHVGIMLFHYVTTFPHRQSNNPDFMQIRKYSDFVGLVNNIFTCKDRLILFLLPAIVNVCSHFMSRLGDLRYPAGRNALDPTLKHCPHTLLVSCIQWRTWEPRSYS